MLYIIKVVTKIRLQFIRVRENHDQVHMESIALPIAIDYEFVTPPGQNIIIHWKLAAKQIAAGIKTPSSARGEKKILPLIPKKKTPPPLYQTMGAEGWGLRGRQGFSLCKIVVWVTLAVILPFVFVCLWLALVSKTDLQNAFIPSTFISSLIVIGLGIPQLLTTS
jgi:hypothetical protein